VGATLIEQAWAAVSGDAAPPAPLTVGGASGHLPSRHPVEDAAVACVGAALLAADALSRQRRGPAVAPAVDRGHVAAAVRSERYFRIRGEPAGMGFARLSRFWRARDGWVRTHANYPWHRAALLGVLGTPEDRDAVAAAIGALPAAEVEERVVAAGGIAAAMRSAEEWRAHPQGRALAEEPLVAHSAFGGGAPRLRPPADLPLRGVRVLDLTRVIAGPVCTRFLGALGADVLRIDPPAYPDMEPGSHSETLLGKRSALLDLATPEGRTTLTGLLHGADVLVLGYRGGSLARFGLAAEQVAERHPGLVIVRHDAWGHGGPWAGRRGFDSIVQSASGIAVREAAGGERPGALPCQLLDHGTGYLAAAAALDGLRRQAALGGTHVRSLSLARTAAWLTATPVVEPAAESPEDEAGRWSVELPSAAGPASVVAPPGSLGGRPLAWPGALTAYGADAPVWRPRDLDG
jgi:crotonobetainyl-CoA:carnitine CoA-transferase CaiB-like acyl-CoA transferase